MLSWLTEKITTALVHYLEKPTGRYEPFSVTDPAVLRACLRPGDILLVEGNKRVSMVIKYLTQSTWSHAAMYVGDALGPAREGGEPNTLIEARASFGVGAVPLSTYAKFNTRICRPVGLSDDDRKKVIDFMVASVGKQYDTRNVIDLMRYLIPQPPVPVRWRRRMLALGSGDPTRAICSTLIAQAFQSVRYPILPEIETVQRAGLESGYLYEEILHIRHHSLFTPRDFDLSPYFAIVKPTIERGFDYKTLVWHDEPGGADAEKSAASPS